MTPDRERTEKALAPGERTEKQTEINTVRLRSMLGLSRRAGRLGCGMDATLSALRGGTAKVVLLAADASARTVKTARDKSAYRQVSALTLPLTREEMGQACGIPEISVCAVTDDSFAGAIVSLCGAGTASR